MVLSTEKNLEHKQFGLLFEQILAWKKIQYYMEIEKIV